MKKIFYLFITIFAGFIFSCAPLKKPTCEERFLKTMKYSQASKKVSNISGSIYSKGIVLLFRVSLKNDVNVDLFTPFGEKIAEFYQKKEKACVKIRENKICGKYSDVYKEIFHEYIPLDLIDLIVGKVSLSENSKYTCENSTIKVKDKDFTYVFSKNKLKEVIFKGYRLFYEYEENIPTRIVLKNQENTLLKIFIRDIQ